jgi:hypothetical protein
LPDEAEILMAEVLRFAADNSPGISKDYLAVLLPRPSLRSIRMRYMPNENEIKTLAPSGDFPFVSCGPFSYSPWIVTQRYQAGPQVLVNPSSVIIGPPDLLLEIEGPSSNGGLVHESGFISQVRPEWPPKKSQM